MHVKQMPMQATSIIVLRVYINDNGESFSLPSISESTFAELLVIKQMLTTVESSSSSVDGFSIILHY